MKKILAFGIAFTFFTVVASAQQRSDALHRGQRQEQTGRGELTKGERSHLRQESNRYHKTERRFKRDGHLSRYERKKLHGMKRHHRHHAHRARHNDRRRVM